MTPPYREREWLLKILTKSDKGGEEILNIVMSLTHLFFLSLFINHNSSCPQHHLFRVLRVQ